MRAAATTVRKDGREPSQLRPLDCEQGLLARADGSSRVSQGATVVLASVFGPMEVEMRRELPDRAALDVQVRPPSGLDGPREREWQSVIVATLNHVVLTTHHPRTLITVVLHVVADHGSALAVAFNAAIAALVDAGVPMRSLPAACACALVGSLESPLMMLDPTEEEESLARGTLTLALDSAQGGLLFSHVGGTRGSGSRGFAQEEVLAAVAAARSAVKAHSRFMRVAVGQQHKVK